MREIIRIIPREYRRKGVRVACTLFLRAALNFVGLAVLLPVLALVLDPGSLTGDGPMARIYDALGFKSAYAFAMAVCGAVVAMIVLKNIVNMWLAHSERTYIYNLYRTLSRQLYVTYHDKGLGFIKASNSAVLTRNVNVVCLSFAAGVLKPAASIAADVMLLAMLFVALAIYTPMAALLTVCVFAPAMWLYYALVRRRINRYGELENKAQREKSRIVAETFRGYADIEINGAFRMMLRKFDRAMDQVVRMRCKEADMGMLPQTMTEIGVVAGMALLVAVSLGGWAGGAIGGELGGELGGGANAQILFGVFAVAALRLMPSVRNILMGWTTIKYNLYTVDILRDAAVAEGEGEGAAADAGAAMVSDGDATGAADAAGEAGTKLGFEREITVRGLVFRFPDGSGELFCDLDLTIAKGERLGIRGASGTGKTTLFNLLLGLYSPTGGEIAIDGVALTASNRRAWQNRIGYVSQNLFLTDGSFAANVALGVAEDEIDRPRVMRALQAAQMGDFVAALPQGADTPIGESGCRLSGGQRQRIGIARALYRRADVLFFDEATSALDSQTEEEINRSITTIAAEHKGVTIVVIAHRESSLEYCTRIITLGK